MNASLFATAMRRFNGFVGNDSFHQALIWLRQAEQIAATTDDDTMKASIREAYVQLILLSAGKFEVLALHCGNITRNHASLAGIISDSTTGLVNHLRNGKEIPYAVALAVQGFSTVLQEFVSTHVESCDLITSAELLDQVFDNLDALSEQAASLTRSADLCELSLDEKVTIAATAMSNAGYELNWLLPSDWDKARFYCQRVLLLLTQKPDGPTDANAARQPLSSRFQSIVDALPAALAALQQKHYRDSKRRIKAIETALQEVVV